MSFGGGDRRQLFVSCLRLGGKAKYFVNPRMPTNWGCCWLGRRDPVSDFSWGGNERDSITKRSTGTPYIFTVKLSKGISRYSRCTVIIGVVMFDSGLISRLP